MAFLSLTRHFSGSSRCCPQSFPFRLYREIKIKGQHTLFKTWVFLRLEFLGHQLLRVSQDHRLIWIINRIIIQDLEGMFLDVVLDRLGPKVWVEMWTHPDSQCQTLTNSVSTLPLSLGRCSCLMSSANDVIQKEWYFAIEILVTLPMSVGCKLSIFMSQAESI